MEFKRIDDTKFQCLLNEEDLEDNNISLDDFFRNDTEKIHGLLDVILEEAQKSIGVMLDGGVMSLQLAPQPDHSILLTISSGTENFSEMLKQAGQKAANMMTSLKKDSNIIKKDDAKDKIKEASFDSIDNINEKNENNKSAGYAKKTVVFEIKNMETAEELAMNLPHTWGIKNSLYKDEKKECFYIILERVRAAENKYSEICRIVSEYADAISYKNTTLAYLNEHCSLIMENNAINIMKKYCE